MERHIQEILDMMQKRIRFNFLNLGLDTVHSDSLDISATRGCCRSAVKFSDLKNPAAASAVIEDFKKRFSTKVCLSPTGGCSGGIISAHTLSAEAMLRPIARDGHVYAVR
jgi:hypothetical protein